MTMRLSKSSFTGTARTDVAVGTSSEAFMFFATAADGPRSVTYSGPSAAAVAGAALAGALRGRRGGCRGRGLRRSGRGSGGGRRGRRRGGGCGGRSRSRRPRAAPERRAAAPVRPAAGGRSYRGPRGCGRRGRACPPCRAYPACSRRRSPTRRGRPNSGPGGTAGRSRRRATHWGRKRRQGSSPARLGRSRCSSYWGTVTTRRQPPSSASQGDGQRESRLRLPGRAGAGRAGHRRASHIERRVSALEMAGNKRGSASTPGTPWPWLRPRRTVSRACATTP